MIEDAIVEAYNQLDKEAPTENNKDKRTYQILKVSKGTTSFFYLCKMLSIPLKFT